VRLLCGGARHTIDRDGSTRTQRSFAPETIPRHADTPTSAGALAERLTELTRNAVHPIERVGCAITAGRDSRVLMALLQAAGEDALYFTGGSPRDPDVVIAGEITERLGLRHEVVSRDPLSATFDWTDAAARFMRQNDGLSSLLQLPDYIELRSTDEPLGVKLGGVGGEIGRAGTGELTAIATNVPLLSRSVAVQRKLLAMKCRNEGGLMTPDATEEVARYLDEFRCARMEEGWRPAELQEAFYTFERVGRWGATGTRRVSGTDDGFSPLCLRPFIEYCFSLKSSERYTEAVPYRLLAALSPTLLAHRFEEPLPRQQPWLAPILATRELAGAIYSRAASRRPARRSPQASEAIQTAATPRYAFQHAWFEDRLPLLRDLFSTPSSDLWSYISRPKLEALLDGSEAERARYQEQLLRATTVFWHFQGSAPTGSREQPDTLPAPADVPT
jgi:asparagine synthase (glutamine-hydrolysing)